MIPSHEELEYFKVALLRPTIPFDNPNHTFFPTLYNLYCINGSTIPGEVNVTMGCIYIFQYIFYLLLYIPSLTVIILNNFHYVIARF